MIKDNITKRCPLDAVSHKKPQSFYKSYKVYDYDLS